MKKIAIGVIIAIGTLLSIGIVCLFVLSIFGPEIHVVNGKQIPKRHMNQIESLGLLDEGEQIAYFYSDALSDIREGMYFVSDKNLVVYSEDWDPPAIITPFEDILELSADYNASFWEDSLIWVRLTDETEFAIPVSSDRGGDKRFFEYLFRMCQETEAVEYSAQDNTG